MGADNVNWLVLASHLAVAEEDTLAALEEQLTELIAPLRGEYDGWEVCAP